MNKNQDIITNWWEKKRILYNLMLLPILVYELFINHYKNPLLSMGENPIFNYGSIDLILWTLFLANIPYCIGTGLESTINLSENKYNKYHAWFLFVTGLLVSWIFIKMNHWKQNE